MAKSENTEVKEKTKFVTLFYNKPNQHTYVGHQWNIDKDGKAGTLNKAGKVYAENPTAILGKSERRNHGALVRLRPGANVVPQEVFDSMKEDDAIATMIEDGVLTIFNPIMKGEKAPETAGMADDLEPFSDKDAIKLINETMELEKLKKFLENLGKDRTDKVRDAIKTQITKIEKSGKPESQQS